MGWHIPTDEEYNELERWVLERIASPHPQYTCNTNQWVQRRCADNSGTDEGGEFGVARSLRKIGTGKGVGIADGLTDFALVGGGGRSWAGTVYYAPYRTYLWTSTIAVSGGGHPLARTTREEYSTFGSGQHRWDIEGFSVRCIQDRSAPDAPMSFTK